MNSSVSSTPRPRGRKLIPEQRHDIRTLYASGNYRLADLALRYGVSVALIGQIASGKSLNTKTEMIDSLRKALAALSDRVAVLERVALKDAQTHIV